jgi:hypothetical protein
MSFKIEILLIPLLQVISHIFEISEDDHPLKIVGHARDYWWTLDFANAFVSQGVNSRGELVPSHRASRRRLGDNHHFSVLVYTNTEKSWLLLDNIDIEGTRLSSESILLLTNWMNCNTILGIYSAKVVVMLVGCWYCTHTHAKWEFCNTKIPDW